MSYVIKYLQRLYEYDNDFFSYNQIEKDMWYDLVKSAMDKFKVYFDLENNDSKKIQRVITIPQKEWNFTECKFKCELMSAGGDWEIPVLYFRCQVVSGYCFNEDKAGMRRSSSYNSHFCYIPSKKEGNYQLVRRPKDGKWNAPNNDEYTEGIDPKPDESKCWDSLEKYLKMLVDLEIEKVESEKEANGQKQPEAEAK